MFWQDETDEHVGSVSDEVVDVVFQLRGREIPCDHAWLLMNALVAQLPWFGTDPVHGLHLIHPAASGNGWFSPDDYEGEIMYLPRRARLAMRLPKERVHEATTLQGQMLQIGNHGLTIGSSEVRPLSLHTTLHARHVISGAADPSEVSFLSWVAETLATMGIRCRKMVAGREYVIRTPEADYRTRSLLLADLRQEEAILIQQQGLGRGRHLGCGLFLPHKSVRDLFVES